MKRYLLIIIILLGIFCSNIIVFAQENESEAYEIPTEEDSKLSSNSDITNEELENAIIIGSGEEEQISTLFLDKFAVYYFSQLNKNFGNNYIGSCSYTAAAMLLSFYDTYWNDNIIPEHYESQDKNLPNSKLIADILESPGIKMESIPHGTTKEQYKTIIDNDKDEYFHLKLIDIGLNIFDDYALFPSSVEELLEYYLYNVVGFSTSEVTVERITAGNLFDGITVREYVINKVTQGIPVFVSATSLGEGAHSYIIYDYDVSTDELYCHLGGHYNDDNVLLTHVKFSTIDYTLFEGAVTINFTPTSQHSHSNNYVDSDGNTYCSCDFPCHPEHEHSYKPLNGVENIYHTYDCLCAVQNNVNFLHTFTYVELDNSKHINKCTQCEYQVELPHNLDYTNINDELNHREYCTVCGHIGISYHNFECDGSENGLHYEECVDCGYRTSQCTRAQFTSIDANNHSAVCLDCEYTVSTEPHNWVYTSISALYHEGHCADCGEIKTTQQSHSWKVSNDPKYVECSYCGYLKLKPTLGGGEIIPVQPFNKEDDIEEETE